MIRRYLAYMPVCVRENYNGDPEPGGKYGIRIRKWKNNSCVEIVAKLLDKPEEGVPRKAFYIQVEMFQPAVVGLGWLEPNKCKHSVKTVYETIEDPLWTTSMADTILTLKTQEERLDAWIRFMASLSLGQSRERYLKASALQLMRAFQFSMIAVTVFGPTSDAFGVITDANAVKYVPGPTQQTGPNLLERALNFFRGLFRNRQ